MASDDNEAKRRWLELRLGNAAWTWDDRQVNPGIAEPQPVQEPLGERAAQYLEALAKMVREKNLAYGNSIENNVRVFTSISALELVLARAEDKISRIARGSAAGEDSVGDLIGYLALAHALGWKGQKV